MDRYKKPDLGSTDKRKTRIATVTPVYRNALTPDEQISLRHLRHFLAEYDNIIVAPNGLDVDLAGFAIRRFGRRYFQSATTYNRLLLSKKFYEAFSDYDYILIYQLDCLVFSSNLDFWCNLGWDYIGAPWLKDFVSVHPADDDLYSVGNGGFSLRCVSSCLNVLRTCWRRKRTEPSEPPSTLSFPHRWLSEMAGRSLWWHLRRRTANEDGFWSWDAHLFQPDFRVAPVDVGRSFSFEMDPAFCFEKNKRRLPFGCHAWPKYDRTFWEPHLLQ